MPDFKMISADSHVVEPPDMWVDYIDTAFKDRRRVSSRTRRV